MLVAGPNGALAVTPLELTPVNEEELGISHVSSKRGSTVLWGLSALPFALLERRSSMADTSLGVFKASAQIVTQANPQ
jgi:hypothetical protein